MSNKVKSSRDSRTTSTARLAAVQGLYEIELTGAQLDYILFDFLGRRWTVQNDIDAVGQAEKNERLADPDKKKFSEVVRGVLANKADIDKMIEGALSENSTLEKLDVIMRSILRAGTFELFHLPAVPVKVIINEYVDLAHAFYSGKEPGFVNGILDRLAKVIRQKELGN